VTWSFALAAALLALTLGLLGFARTAAAQDAQSVTAELAEANDSGITGTAVLTAQGDETLVVIDLVGAFEEGTEGHLYASDIPDCTGESHGAAPEFFDFLPVDADGHSETLVPAPFSELTNGDYWIHLHEPAVERGEGLVCGQVPNYSAPVTTPPSTGVGSTAGDPREYLPLLAGLALASMLTAVVLLRRGRRGAAVAGD
jgi:hypothetical protein